MLLIRRSSQRKEYHYRNKDIRKYKKSRNGPFEADKGTYQFCNCNQNSGFDQLNKDNYRDFYYVLDLKTNGDRMKDSRFHQDRDIRWVCMDKRIENSSLWIGEKERDMKRHKKSRLKNMVVDNICNHLQHQNHR